MKIIVAPDKFKGSLTSFEVCDAIEKGLRLACPNFEILKLPMADGGDGLSEVLAHYTGANAQTAKVLNPLFQPVEANWLLSGDGKSAFIEMAKASGLGLLPPHERNPERTSTIGTGQLIRAAIEKEATEITIGIGGSATNDGGMGMAAALGYRFLDAAGDELNPAGDNLHRIERIDKPDGFPLKGIAFRVACDVKNTLCGENGAARIYAPQKGADPEMVERLEEGMKHFAGIVKRDVGIDVLSIEGGGAAGGLGAGCVAFLGADLVSGIDLVTELSGIQNHLADSDFVITGEGKLDAQSLQGKVVAGVSSLARHHQKPLIAFCGSLLLDNDDLYHLGIRAAFSILNQPMETEAAIKNAASLLQSLACNVGNLLRK